MEEVIKLDRKTGETLVRKGGLLRVTVTPVAEKDREAFLGEIRVWIEQAGTLQKAPEVRYLWPAAEYLQGELQQRLADAANAPPSEDA